MVVSIGEILFLYDGIEVDYIDKGEGEVVVFLHGWGGDKYSLAPIYDLLTCRRVVSISCPYDLSVPWTVSKYTDMVAKLLEYLGVVSYTVVGHSFGGRLALELGNRAKALVIIDGAGIKPRYSLKRHWRILRYKVCKKLVCWHIVSGSRLDKYGSEDYKLLSPVMKQTFVNIVNHDQTKMSKGIRIPTTILWGKSDKDTPLYMAHKLNKNIHNSNLILFSGGHFMYLDHAQEIAEIIENIT